MALLQLRGIAKTFGSRTILDGLEFDVEAGARGGGIGAHGGGEATRKRGLPGGRQAGARVGVIGPNGGGKSTMMRILAGLDEPDAGESTQRRGLVVAYLPQQVEGDERTTIESLRAARPDLDELDHELARVAAQLGALGGDLDRMTRVLRRQEELVDRWTAAGGPGFEGRARALL